MKRVNVAVGVIVGPQQDILLAKRPDDKHQGGLWEFPGGKIEASETTPQALQRELQEELGLAVSADSMAPLIEISHDYPDKSVRLDVYWVPVSAEQAQTAHGAEGQQIGWYSARALTGLPFPAANEPIIQAILEGLSVSR